MYYFCFLAALTFAQRAFCAAAIRLRPAADIVLFLPVAEVLRLTPFMYTCPNVLRAALTR